MRVVVAYELGRELVSVDIHIAWGQRRMNLGHIACSDGSQQNLDDGLANSAIRAHLAVTPGIVSDKKAAHGIVLIEQGLSRHGVQLPHTLVRLDDFPGLSPGALLSVTRHLIKRHDIYMQTQFVHWLPHI